MRSGILISLIIALSCSIAQANWQQERASLYNKIWGRQASKLEPEATRDLLIQLQANFDANPGGDHERLREGTRDLVRLGRLEKSNCKAESWKGQVQIGVLEQNCDNTARYQDHYRAALLKFCRPEFDIILEEAKNKIPSAALDTISYLQEIAIKHVRFGFVNGIALAAMMVDWLDEKASPKVKAMIEKGPKDEIGQRLHGHMRDVCENISSPLKDWSDIYHKIANTPNLLNDEEMKLFNLLKLCYSIENPSEPFERHTTPISSYINEKWTNLHPDGRSKKSLIKTLFHRH